HDAEEPCYDLLSEGVGQAELIQRHDEPEQPRNRELALAAHLAKLDNRRDEKRLPHPSVESGLVHCPFNPVSNAYVNPLLSRGAARRWTAERPLRPPRCAE